MCPPSLYSGMSQICNVCYQKNIVAYLLILVKYLCILSFSFPRRGTLWCDRHLLCFVNQGGEEVEAVTKQMVEEDALEDVVLAGEVLKIAGTTIVDFGAMVYINNIIEVRERKLRSLFDLWWLKNFFEGLVKYLNLYCIGYACLLLIIQ